MILLDYKDRRPIYEQVVEKLQDLMICGVLEQDSQLPSVRSLATDLSINPNTIQRAYGELERQGYIYSVKGKGSFVADSSRMRAGKLKEWKGRFTAFVEEGIKIGVTAEDMTGLVEETFCGRMAGLVEETFCGHMTERGDGHD